MQEAEYRISYMTLQTVKWLDRVFEAGYVLSPPRDLVNHCLTSSGFNQIQIDCKVNGRAYTQLLLLRTIRHLISEETKLISTGDKQTVDGVSLEMLGVCIIVNLGQAISSMEIKGLVGWELGIIWNDRMRMIKDKNRRVIMFDTQGDTLPYLVGDIQ